MPLPFDYVGELQRRRKNNRRAKQSELAEISGVLGNERNKLFVPGKNGNEVYVRLFGNSENNNANYLPSTTAFVRGSFFEYSGSPVLLKYNRNNDLVVIGPDEIQVAGAGNELSLSSLNAGSKQNKFLNLDNVLRALGRPVSRGNDFSTLVSVAQFIYDHYGNYIKFNGTPLKADKIDLASYIPTTANNQRLVQLWLDTYNNSIQVTSNTEQSSFVDLDQTDYDEAWLGSVRFQDWLPLQSYVLQGGNTATITQKNLGRDHRQQFHLPNELGNEYELTINTRIRTNRQWVIHDSLTIPAGYTLSIEAGAVVQIINNSGEFALTPNITRVTSATYTILASDKTIFANTDSNTITLTLPVGVQGTPYRIVNTGSSNNNVTIVPTGAEHLMGVNATFTLQDGEALIIEYDTTDGWY